MLFSQVATREVWNTIYSIFVPWKQLQLLWHSSKLSGCVTDTSSMSIATTPPKSVNCLLLTRFCWKIRKRNLSPALILSQPIRNFRTRWKRYEKILVLYFFLIFLLSLNTHSLRHYLSMNYWIWCFITFYPPNMFFPPNIYISLLFPRFQSSSEFRWPF